MVGCLAYVPHGPAFGEAPNAFESPSRIGDAGNWLCELAENLRKWLPPDTFAVRFDLPWIAADHLTASLSRSRRLVKNAVPIQPPVTVLLDITQEPDAIIAAMKPKTRYNIRLAERKGVVVRSAASDELAVWYDIYVETAKRDHIAIHSYEYYRALFDIAKSRGDETALSLLFAEHNDEVLAGIVVARWGDCSTYLYGASANKKRNYMPSYALQWEAIKQARSWGAKYYDLFGIPFNKASRSLLTGLYRFKTGFGGDIVTRLGLWEYSYRRIVANSWHMVEGLREFYYKRLRR